MRSKPLRSALLHIGQFVSRNVRAAHLAVCGIFLLAWSFHPRGKVEPVVSFSVTLGNTLANRVKYAKGRLCPGISLLGGFVIPFRRLMTDRMSLTLAQADPEVAAALDQETLRQHEGLEMIASENFVSEAVLEAAGSIFTNKYAEGYPGRRYYGGCEYADVVENLARDRAKQIFGGEHQRAAALRLAGQRVGLCGGAAGGRHHSGPRPGARRPPDPRAQAELQRQALPAHVLPGAADTELIDYDELEAIAEREKPKVIIGGGSAYPRLWDFARMRQIADKVGAVYIFDMAHIAGLVAGGVHPSPVPHAHITTTTTHKTLRGPRAG
jgi:glycine hydroxymethyltransferase